MALLNGSSASWGECTMKTDDKDSQPVLETRASRMLVLVASVIFAAAFVVAILGHWRAALVVIGFGLIPAIAAEVLPRR